MSRPFGAKTRDGAPFWAAVLAVWSLIVAGALPAPALARADDRIVICTFEGARSVDRGGQHQDGADCQRHCLAAAMTAIEPRDPARIEAKAAWQAIRPANGPSAEAPALSRFAPRPPSQGPPGP